MKKYNKEIINNYINGLEIKEYSIDELEDDKDFMIQVIELTNDKNFYKLCSEKVKKDYGFVKYLINKFKNDISFICDVADFYIDNTEDEISRIELVIVMLNLTNNKDDEKHNEYETIINTIFTTKRVQIEMGMIKLNDESASDEIGMGFLLMYDSYNSSKIILDFYAKKMIDEIFKEFDIELENVLHQQFNNPEEINKLGINNYMLNFISYYDAMLASYLSSNIYLMKDFKNKIEQVQNNWKTYININEAKRYNLILNKVHEYMEQAEIEGMLSETDLLYYIGNKLGIASKIAKYDGVSSELVEDIIKLDNELVKDALKTSFIDKVHYNNVKRIISSLAFSDENVELIDSASESKEGKVLKLELNDLK